MKQIILDDFDTPPQKPEGEGAVQFVKDLLALLGALWFVSMLYG